MDVYSSLNFMNNVGTAYRVDRSGYRHVDIQNNLLDTRRDGIVLNMNDGAAYVLVQNNDITFARNLPLGQYTKGYYAIRVNEANTLNPSSQILNNIIHYRQGASTAYGGIGLISARKYLVAGNQLHMTDNASNRLGIYLGGCEEADLSCNQILGANNGYPDLSQSGIRNFMGHAPEISCNTVDRTTNGMLFSGWALDTDLKGNEFNNHKYGLHLEQDALIGEQELRGNLWLATAQVWGAWYESPANALLNRIKYDQGQPNNIPSSYAPSSWFQPFSGTTFQCATEDYCAVIHERCTDCPKEIYERIADETLENGEYTDETRWTLKGDLYATLKKAPELMNDPDMAAFYDVVQNTVAGQLKDLDDERLSLFDLDPTVLAQLQLNRQQLLVLQAQVKIALEQLTAPDLTEAQKIALEGSISGLQQDMAGLTAYNKTALDLAVNSRVLSAESVKTTNTGIAASELTETNYKTVNKIYLGTVAKDIDEFTGAEAQDLFAVANQCPLVGGNAVFQARALYYLIDPEQDFDDPSLCLQHGLITKSQKIRAEVAASMIPNPAVDAATLVLPAPLEEAGQLVLYDAVGAEVLRIPIPADQQRTLVNTARLATGVYHYRVLSDQGEPGNGKLSIAR